MLFEATELAALCYSIKRKRTQRDHKAEKRVKSFSTRRSTGGRLGLNKPGARKSRGLHRGSIKALRMESGCRMVDTGG